MSGPKAVATVSRPDLLDRDGGGGTFRGVVYDLLAVGAPPRADRAPSAKRPGCGPALPNKFTQMY